jgi:hypothetical protein
MLSLFLLALSILLAAAEVVLNDGNVIQAAGVQRENGNYVILMESGEKLSIPVELVKEIRLEGQREPEPKAEPAQPEVLAGEDVNRSGRVPGLVKAEPQVLAGEDVLETDRAPGLIVSEPQTLAGDPVRQPSRAEQTAALGPPAEFQRGINNPTWRPETDWNMDPRTQNNFAPSTWSDDIVDHDWEPESDWDMDPRQQNDFAPSTFPDNIIDNSWQPTDAFADKKSAW